MNLSMYSWIRYNESGAIPYDLQEVLEPDMMETLLSDELAEFDIRTVVMLSREYPVKEMMETFEYHKYDNLFVCREEVVEKLLLYGICCKDAVSDFWKEAIAYQDFIEENQFDNREYILIVPKYYYE